MQQQIDALTKEFNEPLEAIMKENAELSGRLVAAEDKLNTLQTQSSVVSHAKEAEKIPIKNLPKRIRREQSSHPNRVRIKL